MFQNTHAFVASKLYKSDDSLLLVGSILPDIAVTGVIKWDGGLHGKKEAEDFYKFIQEKYPSFLNLAKGVLAHNI